MIQGRSAGPIPSTTDEAVRPTADAAPQTLLHLPLRELLLCGFLVVHLEGNLLLFVSAEKYNAYAHFLHSQEELLMVAETGLFLLFLAHLYLAFTTAWVLSRTPNLARRWRRDSSPCLRWCRWH